MTAVPAADTAAFIRAHLDVAPVPAVPEIRVYCAHPQSGLRRLAGAGADGDAPPPYWAHRWAGGLVLARYILDRPDIVSGRRVLDLGAGSGVVAIAAALSGAAAVIAADTDPNAAVAAGLNAEINGVAVETVCADPTSGDPPDVDIVLVGDLFYERGLAGRVRAFLRRCREAGIEALVGDPGRAHLPLALLRPLAQYAVPDFGTASHADPRPSTVFAFGPRPG